MKLKTNKIFLAIYVALFIASLILTEIFANNSRLVIIFAIIFLSLFCIGTAVAFVALKIVVKRDVKLMQSLVEQKNFEKIKGVFEAKYQTI